MGGQIVTFFVGQCGIQIGSSCWELYCLEHCLTPDGKVVEDADMDDCGVEAFFFECDNGNLVPRTIFIDLEPTVLDEVKVGSYRDLFEHDWLVGGHEDAANNFARGFYSCGKTVVRNVVAATRKVVEACNNVTAFMAHHSFGGGTGSGFSSLLLDYLSAEYGKRNQLEFGVFPSPSMCASVVEPYNCVLALHTPMESVDLAAFFENESLYRICTNNLMLESPLFPHINRMAAQVISGMTCSMRFEGPINANIIDYQTNLVPYPRIHFPMVSFSPFISPSKASRTSMSTKEITMIAYNKDNQMVGVDPLKGVYMSCCMLYRGSVNCRETNDTISYMKSLNNTKWVDWCPTGYKVGITYQPMLAIPASGMGFSSKSVTILCNSSVVKQVISRINKKFMMMYSRQSFVHWYVAEGMEEEEFKEAFEDVLTLEKDFELLDQTAKINQNSANSNMNENYLQNSESTAKTNTYFKSQSDYSEKSEYLSSFTNTDDKSTVSSYSSSFHVSKEKTPKGLIEQNRFVEHENANLPVWNIKDLVRPSDTRRESNMVSTLKNSHNADHMHCVAPVDAGRIKTLNSSKVFRPLNRVSDSSSLSTTKCDQIPHKTDNYFLNYLLNKLEQRPLSKMKLDEKSASRLWPSNENVSHKSGFL